MSAQFTKSGSGTNIQFAASGGGGAMQFGFSTPGARIVSGAGAANMSNVGMTALVSAYQDDTANPWTLPMDFYFLGTNYGNNLNGGMGWCSNFVISFSLSGRGISLLPFEAWRFAG